MRMRKLGIGRLSWLASRCVATKLQAVNVEFSDCSIHLHQMTSFMSRMILSLSVCLGIGMSLSACGGGGSGGGAVNTSTPSSNSSTSTTGNNTGLQGLGPNSLGQNPNSDGYYPDANGRYPDKNGIYPDTNGNYPTPAQVGYYENANGVARSYSTAGPLDLNNPFFKPFGNGRSCVTCHDPSAGFSLTPELAQKKFFASNGSDPLFTMNDAAVSPKARANSLAEKEIAFAMLLNKGLFRIGMKIPESAEFELQSVDDPYDFAGPNELSFFRRPLPSANLKFLSHVMWDGRDTLLDPSSTNCIPGGICYAALDLNLARQANNATLGHAQAAQGLSAAEQRSIVEFEKTLFSAQIFSPTAGFLDVAGAAGGAEALSKANFTFGMNDLEKGNFTTGAPFNRTVMTNFSTWLAFTGTTNPSIHAVRQSIARGEVLFNTRVFHRTPQVGAPNDLNIPLTRVTCSSCHNTPQVGGASAPLAVSIFTSEASLRTPDLPLYVLRHKATGATQKTTDPGIAMHTGKWEDIGRFKVPSLRGLSARAPYFHNGSAETLLDVVFYYDTTFQIGFTGQEVNDLVAFLSSL
ncbi:cytochrome C [Undibacterium cyanobacteriorum]|uniref:Cytochrome C n=1 Tax=Undibacterium cyanobacteriorum TaxID=3073561 RepID=A0ABY9RF62_9BURK|nr:cytochrome C [Undibacterium sp. 20NA77.5]WMW79866.1 cytochrome C [Undibacterium sp. 20NA77.5]